MQREVGGDTSREEVGVVGAEDHRRITGLQIIKATTAPLRTGVLSTGVLI